MKTLRALLHRHTLLCGVIAGGVIAEMHQRRTSQGGQQHGRGGN